ncbi:tetratricopeptide repeat protein [Saltatorellus ferox]|uniref:tetratricopeptide repeat protein n=1 Tax=Saltatorellus ferox TaxID=2528018 RepID=UPI003AF3B191
MRRSAGTKSRPEDLVEAYAWTVIAVDLGQDASRNLELLTDTLEPLQLVRAKRRHRALEAELLGEQAPERPIPDYPSIDESPLRPNVPLDDANAEGDKRLALRIFQAHGENGHAIAAYNAGILLEDHDLTEAFSWFHKAATLGELDGAYRAGLALVLGEGCEKDLEAGTTWLQTAADGGVEAAAEALATLAFSK